MNTGKIKHDPAFPLLTVDIISNVLRHAQNPGQLANYITNELRELTGSRTVAILHNRHETNPEYCVFCVNPARRIEKIKSSEIQKLAELCHKQKEILRWNGDGPEESDLILRQMNYGPSIGIPLKIGDIHVGAIILLGLPDEQHIDHVMKILEMISTIVALVLRNSFLYSRQENIIDDRTRQLAESQERYRVLVEGTENFVTRVDKNGKFLFVNQASENIFGLKPEDCIGLSAFDFVHPDDREMTIKAFNNWINEKCENITLENRQVSRTGEIRDMLWTSKLVFDDSGEVAWIDGIARDITERKKIERERERLMKDLALKNKELESIVYIASHDLKSPLVNIMGFSGELTAACEQLRRELENEENFEQKKSSINDLIRDDINLSVDFIKAGAVKMQSLIDGLLRLSRVGSMKIETRTIDMNMVIDEILQAMQFQVESAEALIDVEELPCCKGDPSQVNQVFSNLIDNALKYADPSRPCRIDISGRTENGESIYSVTDNGIGIKPQYQKKIFEIFHRLNPKSDVSGEGLGLTIVSRILDRLDGRIWLESEPGEGTTFYVSIPNTHACSSEMQGVREKVMI